jgi:hypothetical protein
MVGLWHWIYHIEIEASNLCHDRGNFSWQWPMATSGVQKTIKKTHKDGNNGGL